MILTSVKSLRVSICEWAPPKKEAFLEPSGKKAKAEL